MQCKLCDGPVKLESPDFCKRMAFRFGGEDFPFPSSDLCPACRHQRRMSFRNEQSLYHRNSSVSQKKILSLYHPTPLWGEPYEVMLEEEWRSDALDPLRYGREIDFSRPFFEQFAELHKAVPRMSIVNLGNENSPYTSHTGYSKNCYLLPCSEHCEDCYFGRFLQQCRNCVDCTTANRSELCYECFQISDCYNCGFLSLSENCHDCYFSENLIGCNHCLFCTNLRRGEYQILNTPVSREEFHKQVQAILSDAEQLQAARKQWQELCVSRIHRPANVRNSEECTGDFLRDSKHCRDCSDVTGCQDCSDVVTGYDLKDCTHCCNFYLQAELNCEILGSTELYHCAFCFYAFRSSEILYSEYIYDSKYLFGCVGMTRGEYSILNTQYSPAEYDRLAAKLVRHMQDTGEWGKQLPSRWSPFGYNETVASDLFPLTREAALARGFLWREPDPRERAAATRATPPRTIAESGSEITKEIFTCQISGEPFRIMVPEYEFYRKNGYALPRIAPRERHKQRELLRFPAQFRSAACARCGLAVTTNVPAELEHTLNCEECFQGLF